MHEIRDYRNELNEEGFLTYEVKYESTDLCVVSASDHSTEILEEIKSLRCDILSYSKRRKDFLGSLVPLEKDVKAPFIVRRMIKAAEKAGVGPMASVAGGIAELIGTKIARKYGQVIIENGGDIFACMKKDIVFRVFAGYDNPLSNLRIRIPKEKMPLGICTSSGKIGPSLSFGKADAVCVISKDVFLADAFATRAANMVNKDSDIDNVLGYLRAFREITGAIIILNERVGIWGDMEIIG